VADEAAAVSADSTVVADGVWAHLAGARPLASAVDRLLARVGSQEVRA